MIPVLALSGVLLGEASWEDFAVRTQMSGREFNVHRFPGFDGELPHELETPSPLDYAEGIDAGERRHIVAHCSGCLPAIEFARMHPEKVASLTLISYWHGAKEWRSRLAALDDLEGYARSRAGMLTAGYPEERMVNYITDAVTYPAGMLQMARSIVKYANKHVYECKVPLAFVIGTDDAVTLPAAQMHVAEKSNGVTCLIRGAGHCPQIERPFETFRACDSVWGWHDAW